MGKALNIVFGLFFVMKKGVLVFIVFSLIFNVYFVSASDTSTSPEVGNFDVVNGNTDPTYNGDMSISVPLFEIPGRMGFPLSLSYSAGIKTHQEASSVGLGWNLGTGSVVRGVQNYIDDTNDQGKIGASISNYGCVDPDGYNSQCGNTVSCTGGYITTPCVGGCSLGQDGCMAYSDEPFIELNSIEGSLFSLNEAGKSGSDDEGGVQDNWFLNFPGGATQMMFGEDGKFYPLSWSAVDIDYTTDVSGKINSFVVKSVDGTEYVFGGADSVSSISSNEADYWTGITIEDSPAVYTDKEIASLEPSEVCNLQGECVSDYIEVSASGGHSYDYYIIAEDDHDTACNKAWICPYAYQKDLSGFRTCGDSVVEPLRNDYVWKGDLPCPITKDWSEDIGDCSSHLSKDSYQIRYYKCDKCTEDIYLVASESNGCDYVPPVVGQPVPFGYISNLQPYRFYNNVAEHIDTWYLNEIKSVYYSDNGDGIVGDGDEGSWVKLNYENYNLNYIDKTPIYNAREIADSRADPDDDYSGNWFGYDPHSNIEDLPGGVKTFVGIPGTFEKIIAVKSGSRKTDRDLVHIDSIETSTHLADFVYSGSNDGAQQLDKISLDYKFGNQHLFDYVFNYAEGTVADPELKAPNGAEFGQRTLKSVQKRSYDYTSGDVTTYDPETSFIYEDCNPSFDVDEYDNKGINREFTDFWGFYSQNKDGDNYIVDDMADGCGANAWSLKEITYPTSGKVTYEYEPNKYDIAPRLTGDVPDWDGAIEDGETPLNELGGGIRVGKIIANDGFDTTDTAFEYGPGVLTRRPSETYDFAAQETIYTFPWDNAGAGSGVYIAYRTITSKTPADGSFGEVVYDYKDPYESRDEDWNDCAGRNVNGDCVAGYLTDNSWKRNYVESVKSYDNSKGLVSETNYVHDTQDVRFQWEMTNDFVDPITVMSPSTDGNPDTETVVYYIKSTLPKLLGEISNVDGVTNTVIYSHNLENGMVNSVVELSSFGNRVSKTEFAFELYPEMKSKNMMTQTSGTNVYENSALRIPVASERTVWSKNVPGAVGDWMPKRSFSGVGSDEILTSTIIEYNQYGAPVEIMDAKGHSSFMYYGTNGDPCSQTSGAFGNNFITCVKNDLDHATKSHYNEFGMVDSITDLNDQEIKYNYDKMFRLKDVEKSTDAGSPKIHYDYTFALHDGALKSSNMNEVLTRQELGDGVEIQSIAVADGLGKSKQVQLVVDESTSIIQDIEYNELFKVDVEYKPVKLQSVAGKMIESMNPFEKLIYNIGLSNPDGMDEHYIISSKSEMDERIKSEISYQLNPLARADKVYPLGKSNADLFVQSNYGSQYDDELGVTLRKNSITDEEGKTSFSLSDEFGNVRKTVDPENNEAVFDYNIKNELINIDFEGIVTENKYDSLGRINQTCNPNSGCENYTYDDNGNLLTVTDDRGFVVKNTYDALDINIIEVEVDKGNGFVTRIISHYDDECSDFGAVKNKGRLCWVENYDDNGNAISKIVYGYDIGGRMIHLESYDGLYSGHNEVYSSYSFGYDFGDNILTILDELRSEMIIQEYNSLGQMERVGVLDFNNGQEIISSDYSYTDAGLINFSLYGNGVSTEYKYTDRDWVTDIEIYDDLINPMMFKEHYAYNLSGNLIGMADYDNYIRDSPEPFETNAVSFGYDSNSRLETVTDLDYYDEGEFNLDSISYIYDEVGNREYRNLDGDITNYVYDDPCSPGEFCYGRKDDRLMSTDNLDCTYDYDEVGNMIEKTCVGEDIVVYEYDYNHLMSRLYHKDPNTGSTTKGYNFIYDVLGRRIAKIGYNSPEGNVITRYSYGIGLNPNVVSETCAGDMNNDGEIGLSDHIYFVPQYMAADYYPSVDFYIDGQNNLADLVFYAGSIGDVYPNCGGISKDVGLMSDSQKCEYLCSSDKSLIEISGCSCKDSGKVIVPHDISE